MAHYLFRWSYIYMEIRRFKKALGWDCAELDASYESSHSVYDL